MLPVLALVGRPNVGKSTLFNRLTRTRDALVADYPGLTRDRLYGFARLGPGSAIVIDTGGLMSSPDDMGQLMAAQVQLAVEEADVVIVMADAGEGLVGEDREVAELVRKSGKPIVLAVNKAEGRAPESTVAEFYELGVGEPIAVSAERGDRIGELVDAVFEHCSPEAGEPAEPTESTGTRIVVVGRPNVGKSTLINRYLGEDRLVTQDKAGTTRDSVSIPFSMDGKEFVLVDTAGIRRRHKVTEKIEKFSIVKALQAVEDADAVIVMLDAREGVTVQDVSLIGLMLDRGRALTLAINKWDGLTERQRHDVREELDRRLPFLDFVKIHFISALHGSNIFDALKSAARAAQAAVRDLPTPRLNDVLQAAITAHPPPLVRRRRLKLSYAHQGGKRPPLIVVHGNQTSHVAGSYRRYLIKCFRKAFRLAGTPIRLELRTSENPFAGRRNKLSPRQVRKQKRIRSHRS